MVIPGAIVSVPPMPVRLIVPSSTWTVPVPASAWVPAKLRVASSPLPIPVMWTVPPARVKPAPATLMVSVFTYCSVPAIVTSRSVLVAPNIETGGVVSVKRVVPEAIVAPARVAPAIATFAVSLTWPTTVSVPPVSVIGSVAVMLWTLSAVLLACVMVGPPATLTTTSSLGPGTEPLSQLLAVSQSPPLGLIQWTIDSIVRGSRGSIPRAGPRDFRALRRRRVAGFPLHIGTLIGPTVAPPLARQRTTREGIVRYY